MGIRGNCIDFLTLDDVLSHCNTKLLILKEVPFGSYTKFCVRIHVGLWLGYVDVKLYILYLNRVLFYLYNQYCSLFFQLNTNSETWVIIIKSIKKHNRGGQYQQQTEKSIEFV